MAENVADQIARMHFLLEVSLRSQCDGKNSAIGRGCALTLQQSALVAVNNLRDLGLEAVGSSVQHDRKVSALVEGVYRELGEQLRRLCLKKRRRRCFERLAREYIDGRDSTQSVRELAQLGRMYLPKVMAPSGSGRRRTQPPDLLYVLSSILNRVGYELEKDLDK